MATAVQIEVRVDDTGVTTGLNKVQGSFKQLSDAVKQAMRNLSEAQAQLGAAAEAGSAQAKKVLQDYEAEVQRAQNALREYSSAAETATASTSALTGAVERQVPQMAAASAAVRLLEGNTQGSIRAAERFLSTTLNLGPALQAAFPVIGALAFLGVIEHVADVTSKFFADTLIYTKAAQQQYDSAVKGSGILLASEERLAQARANLYTTTSSAEQNIVRDLNNEKSQRDALKNRIDAQAESVRKLHNAEIDAQTNLAMAKAAAGQPQFGQGASLAAAAAVSQAEAAEEAARSAYDDASTSLRAMKNDYTTTLTSIATSEFQLNDVQEKAADDARKRAEQNAQAYYEAWKQATGKTAELLKQQDSLQREQDKLFNTFENDQFKQTTSDNKTELDRRSKDTEKAVRDTQHMAQQQARDFQQYTQQLGNDLYQMFNEITSGNIGKLIKDGFTRLFANILAQWIATVQGIGNVSRGSTRGGASGLLGSMLGSILGIGGGGATAGSGTGPYGLPAGVASSFTDFGDFGGPNATLSSGAGGIGPFHGDGSLGIAGDVSGSILGSVLSAGVGTVVLARQQQQQKTNTAGVLSGLLSQKSLSQLAPAAILGSLMLGSKGGTSAAVGGALVGALGLAALYSNNPAIWMAAAPYASLLGPLAGGLIGFGVGSATGSPTLGALSGAGSGALIGSLVAPGIGTLLGAIIGGLSGLFGGLFGGGPSKHSLADKWIQANVIPAINSEITNFEGFQTDYATAIGDLEKLKSDSYTQMKQQFGTDATNDEWNKYVVPAIQQSEDKISGFQNDRNQRSSINFGLPQFAEGGAVTAVLHEGEHVMTRAAVARFGHSAFDAINSAAKGASSLASPGGAEIHIHINAVDASSFSTFLRNGGAQQIADAAKHVIPRYTGFARGRN